MSKPTLYKYPERNEHSHVAIFFKYPTNNVY